MKDKAGRIQANDCVVSASFDAQLTIINKVSTLSFQYFINNYMFVLSTTPQSNVESVNCIHVRVKCCLSPVNCQVFMADFKGGHLSK